MAARQTGKIGIERQMKVSAILTKRLSGMSLREIGEAEGVTPQAICQMVQRVLRERISETVEQARSLELMRLDQLLKAVWPNAMNGDIACIDRCLAIMQRRARLLGLDMQVGGGLRFGPNGPVEEVNENGNRTVRVQIVNDPESARREWLLQQRIVALGGNPDMDADDEPPESTSLN